MKLSNYSSIQEWKKLQLKMPNMKKNILKIASILGLITIAAGSCSDKTQPPLEYFPDMYYSVPYEPLTKAQDPYTDHSNQVPAFSSRNGQTGLGPVEGTISQNKDGVLPSPTPKNTDDYNRLYDKSLQITTSPLDPKNEKKDLERGKILFDHTCAACHGIHGDGQGPIVQSGAYSGVPKYTDREITIGSVHYVLENGRNNMGSFAGQLSPGDRWRVAMYVMHEFKNGSNTPGSSDSASNEESDNTTANTQN